jgi:L-asparaginase II
MEKYSNYQPLIEVTRGGIVESVHFGALAVVDEGGQLIAAYGGDSTVTFLRSSAKPFQALPFIERGGAVAYGLSMKEISILCASHSGTDVHYQIVGSIQKRINVTEDDLLCGVHQPMDTVTAENLIRKNEKPTPNRHNCSGKHTGMLAHARLRNLPTADYINPDHPIQKTIKETVLEMCELTSEQLVVGIDGCSVPCFAMPLYNCALGYARLCSGKNLDNRRAEACQTITQAMTSHPFMVGGPGRFDTLLMEAGQGLIVSKGGAEGYQAIGLLPGALGPGSPAIGIALKISDGDQSGGRGHSLTALEVLRQLGALSDSQIGQLSGFDHRLLINFAGLEVGDIHPCFTLTHS